MKGDAGKIKGPIFSVLNYTLTEEEMLPMHCSTNEDNDGTRGHGCHFVLTGGSSIRNSSSTTEELMLCHAGSGARQE